MKDLEKKVSFLLEKPYETVQYLQTIGGALLKDYKLTLWEGYTLFPLSVDAMYVNRNSTAPFVDSNMHCESADDEDSNLLQHLQSNRPGRIYWHLRGIGGIDLCLSFGTNYALCYTIRAAVINDEEVWGVTKIRDTVSTAFSSHFGHDATDNLKGRIASYFHAENADIVLAPRKDCERTDGELYCIPRSGLRRRDANLKAPLRMLLDLWNENNGISKNQKMILYMEHHPEADLLAVLREQGFRHIPTDIRLRFGIPSGTKLY